MLCRRSQPLFDEALPLFDYHGIAGALIASYKFGNRPSLSALFADLLEPHIRRRWIEYILVPVPPRHEALRKRGWDQVEKIALQLEGRGIKVSRPLERRPSLEQKTLNLEARGENARRAYCLKKGRQPPRLALLLDDVFTSGATASACALALKEGGSESVAFLSIATD